MMVLKKSHSRLQRRLNATDQRLLPRLNISDPNLTRVLLSNRQFATLRLFENGAKINVDEALDIDQRSFGSLYHKEYIDYDQQTKKFYLTALGKQAFGIFETTNVIKEHPGTTFSSYLRRVKALEDYQRRIKDKGNK